MDIFMRLIKDNILCAVVFALYFYVQTCGELLQMGSFFAAVPLAKIIMGRMTIPVRIERERGYPIRELSTKFVKFFYGVWSVLLTELIRRVVLGSVFEGILSITLMFGFLLAYVFSEATGMCYTNVKNYKRGTRGFCVLQWILISVAFLIGSSWVL